MGENDLYKMIGTSRQAVTITLEGKARSEKEQDLFVKEKAEHMIKLLEIKQNMPTQSDENRKKIEKQIEEVKEAYLKLRTMDLRNTYNAILNSQEPKRRPRLPIPKDAYQILLTSRTACSDSIRKDVDDMLWRKKEDLIRFAQRGMETANFSKKQRIELEIKMLEEAYEQIKDKQSREKYNAKMDRIKEKRIQEMQEQQIKREYDCSMKYDESVLYDKEPPHLKRYENVIFHDLQDRNGELIRIAETGKIDYVNFTSVFNSSVSEYVIQRIRDGKEKQECIYGNLSIIDLSIDKYTGKPINPEYYDLVVNKILSRESVEACAKYNHGYIGEIEKTKRGYERTFDNVEQISAVMKFYGEKDEKHKKASQELGG